MRKLFGQMRHYPWGSRTHLAELTGRHSPSPQPEAELWFGAHPQEPCAVDGGHPGQTLAEIIARDPRGELGERCLEKFGPELPFLLKILAAGQPLSLQAHPSAQQAAEGFERENSLGLTETDPKRNYRDPHHKPELMVALTVFEALAGYCHPQEAVKFFEALNVPALQTTIARFQQESTATVMKSVTQEWVGLTPAQAKELVCEVSAGLRRVMGKEGDIGAKATMVLQLAERHPYDPGVIVAMLLHHIRLQPGEGLYIPAGVLHAHLSGLGVEIMANSDNVLRGGLTNKHVDTQELMSVLDCDPTPLETLVIPGIAHEEGEIRYPTPAGEFALSAVNVHVGEIRTMCSTGPRILLCIEGEVEIREGGKHVVLVPGDAVWLSDRDTHIDLTARRENTRVFRAWLP